MGKVLTTKFDTLNIPFGSNDYTCYTYNNDVYIIAKRYGIYKYDFTNKIFTLLYSYSLSFCDGFLYNDTLYIKRTDGVDSSNHPFISFNTYNITTGIYTNSALTLTSTYTLSSASGKYHNGITLPTVKFYDNKIYIAGNGGRFFRGNTTYWTVKIAIFMVYDITTNTYVENSTKGYANTGFISTIVNDYFFSIYDADILDSSASKYYNEYGHLDDTFNAISSTPQDFYGSTGFENDNIIYLLGGQTRTKKVTTFNKQTRAFEDMTLTLPQDTVSDDVAHVVSGGNDTYILFYPDGIYSLTFIEYNLTYKITNPSGDQEYTQLTEQSPVTKVRFNYTDGDTVGYVFNTLSGEVSGTFEITTPEGKRLLGFSPTPNSTRAPYPINTDVEVNIYENYTFYAVFLTYRPPTTTFNIELYQNSAEVNRVDKEQYLTPIGTLLGALREECSMLTPSIVYQSSDVPTFNYVYIPIFNRYYFVTSLSSVSKNVWRMELNCDVLMSYKNEILLLQGVIGRQESDFNPLLVDNELPTQNNPIVEIVDIPSDAFNTQTTEIRHNYVITVIGA